MRLSKPRIAPLEMSELNEDQKAIVAPIAERGPVLNIFMTMARDPAAAKAFLAWGNYILSRKNGLPAREREIVILRIGYLCKSGYEFTQHTRIGLQSGLTEDEIERIKRGADAGWSEADAVLIRACDDLNRNHFVSDAVWAELGRFYDDKQKMDLVYTVGQYTQVSMLLNSFGVQLDKGQTLDPELKGY
ncbi:alkylhydroperoxidase family enzyme [Caulobacter ginsengisoli]|uniref:Alkylhydroperoxidase family enzyme n=1 Tax=Caulobacter ginsengisoli TaxID=400775 RepID=A0ABU0IXL4_9CAUL|nr:carboxymuconolactone decarboxylase family protein [Caulobacter ginsengisoli]MDQ0466752.1 alkylhydroperoxidase family enzyme [Caulobacter ginsengisoli]